MSQVLAPPEYSCPECGKLRVALEQAQQEIARLQAELHELRCQLNRNSSNSSVPPSADPPGAPKPVVKTASGRKPGGQPGHPGSHRRRLPPERIQFVKTYVPTICTGCQTPLPQEPGPDDPEPTWHQVAELPPLVAIVTAHQGHAHLPLLRSPQSPRDPPGDPCPRHRAGLAAVISDFSGRHHVSRRGVEEIVEAVFEAPTSLGTVIALEAETTAALAGAYPEVQQEVRQAAVKNTDETGWREAGQKRWLWAAATATAASFVIHLRRSFAGLQALLGAAISGIVGSDRWSVYSKLPLALRPICWAHLKRDFPKLSDRGGPAEAIGQVGLEVVDCLFADWWSFRRGALDRPGLQARVERMARELQATLEQGCRWDNPWAGGNSSDTNLDGNLKGYVAWSVTGNGNEKAEIQFVVFQLPFVVFGAIRDKWLEFGGLGSRLGLPETIETPTFDGVGRFQNFRGGIISWHPETGAHIVWGLIGMRWLEIGRRSPATP